MFMFIVIRVVTGDYKIMYNIEDDCMTCNSYVVFSQIKKPASPQLFIYVDRHGNWVVGGYQRVLSSTKPIIP